MADGASTVMSSTTSPSMASPGACRRQLRRRRPGEGEVYIGRGHRALGLGRSKWANPFKVCKHLSRAEALARFERYLLDSGLVKEIGELKRKVILCHCRLDEACHGDVLVDWVGRGVLTTEAAKTTEDKGREADETDVDFERGVVLCTEAKGADFEDGLPVRL